MNTEATPEQPALPTWDAPLPAVSLPDDAAEPVAKLQRLSQKGRLAGFERLSDTAFTVGAHGTIYDRTLHASITGNTITFEGKPKRTLPAIVIVVFILVLFPGLPLTHTMILVFFDSFYPQALWITAAWYIPLTLLAIPTMRKQYTKSELLSRAHAEETVHKIASALGGTVAQNDTTA